MNAAARNGIKMKTNAQFLIVILLITNLSATLWIGTQLRSADTEKISTPWAEKKILQNIKAKAQKLLGISGELFSRSKDVVFGGTASEVTEEVVDGETPKMTEESAESVIVDAEPEAPEGSAESVLVDAEPEAPEESTESAIMDEEPKAAQPQLSVEERDAKIDALCLEFRKTLAESGGELLVIGADAESGRFSFEKTGEFNEENERDELGKIKKYISMSTNGRKDIFHKENVKITDGAGNEHNISIRHSLDFYARREGKVNIHGTYFWEIFVDGTPYIKEFVYSSTPFKSPYRKPWNIRLSWGDLTVKCGNADWLLSSLRSQALTGTVEVSIKLSDSAMDAAVEAFRQKCLTSETLPEVPDPSAIHTLKQFPA